MIESWRFPKIISYNTYKELSLTIDQIRWCFSCPVIMNGGWHLSYFGDSSFIKNKIEKSSHQEFNTESIKNINNIQQNINNSTDLFGRDNVQIIKIPIKYNTYLPPEYEKYLMKFVVA